MLLLAACGGHRAAVPSASEAGGGSYGERVEAPPGRDADAAPASDAPAGAPSDPARFDGATASPARAFQVSVPRPNGQTVLFEVTAGGELFQWVTPYPRPAPPARATLLPDWTVRFPDGGVHFELRRRDGALVPTAYAPEMLCVAYQLGVVRCRCEDHTPVVDVSYSIAGSDLLATSGAGSAVVGRVTPAPADAAERLRVLVMIAEWTYSLDDHGDSAHDVHR